MIQIKVSQTGAELQSMQKNGHEYLWQGDPAYWNRRSPILFPVVGTPVDGILNIGGKQYKQGRHGFARFAEFKEVELNHFKMVQEGRNPNYPYVFDLEVNYVPKESGLSVEWKVTNKGKDEMHFQIGAHPAFFLPDYNEADEIHGYFQCYDAKGNVISPVAVNYCHPDGLRHKLDKPTKFFDAEGIMPITGHSFDNDALLLEGSQVASIALLDKNHKPVLRVDCPQAEAYGLWAPAKPGCPFVCIEPWNGISDAFGFEGDIAERDMDHALAPGESFDFKFLINLF